MLTFIKPKFTALNLISLSNVLTQICNATLKMLAFHYINDF